MNRDGYPSNSDLKMIQKWDSEDFIGLFYFISDLWAYDKPKGKWVKGILGWYFEITLITCGWSGNESIIKALLNNFWLNYWYHEWVRGGKHVFQCDPKNLSYEIISDYCKKNSVSRQSVHKSKHLFKFIKVSKNIIYCKKIAPLRQSDN